MLTSEQVRAARMLLRWEQKELAEHSGVSLPTVKRLETRPGVLGAHATTVLALKKTLEDAGVHFIDADAMGPGVRLKSNVVVNAKPASQGELPPPRKMTLLGQKKVAERTGRTLQKSAMMSLGNTPPPKRST